MLEGFKPAAMLITALFLGSCSDETSTKNTLPSGTIVGTIEDGLLRLEGNASPASMDSDIRSSLEAYFPGGVFTNFAPPVDETLNHHLEEIQVWASIPRAHIVFRHDAVTVLAEGAWNDFRDGMFSMNRHSAPSPIRAAIVRVPAGTSRYSDVWSTGPLREDQCQALFDHISYYFRPNFDWPSMEVENWNGEPSEYLVSLFKFCQGYVELAVGSTPRSRPGLENRKLEEIRSKLIASGVDAQRLKPLEVRPHETRVSPFLQAAMEADGEWLIFRYRHQLP